MRTCMTLITVALVAISFAGCGRKEPAHKEIGGIKYPAWVGNPFVEDQFGAVGIAKESLGGAGDTRNNALARLAATLREDADLRRRVQDEEAGDAGFEAMLDGTFWAQG